MTMMVYPLLCKAFLLYSCLIVYFPFECFESVYSFKPLLFVKAKSDLVLNNTQVSLVLGGV